LQFHSRRASTVNTGYDRELTRDWRCPSVLSHFETKNGIPGKHSA